MGWFTMAIDTPHQVRIAFMVAESIQAPNKYQASEGSFLSFPTRNNLDIPAKSIPQNAIVKIVAHFNPRKFNPPNRSVNAYSVVLKLNISKEINAITRINPRTKIALNCIFGNGKNDLIFTAFILVSPISTTDKLIIEHLFYLSTVLR
jgi:hypothetical protein